MTNLNTLQKYSSGSVATLSRPDWENTLLTRGFEPLIKQFLFAVSNSGTNPVSPESSILSHEVCTKSLENK